MTSESLKQETNKLVTFYTERRSQLLIRYWDLLDRTRLWQFYFVFTVQLSISIHSLNQRLPYYNQLISHQYPTYASAPLWPSSGVTYYIYTLLYFVQFGTVNSLLFCRCYYIYTESMYTLHFCRVLNLLSMRSSHFLKVFYVVKTVKTLVCLYCSPCSVV